MTQTVVHVPASEGGGAFDPTDITIADNTSPAFLVQDSSTEYMRIDTTTGNSRIQIDTGIANQAFSMKETREIQLRCGANNQFLFSGDNTIDAYAHTFNHRQFSGGKFTSLDAGGSEILRIDEDSTTTFTLDDGSGATFTITDDASPTPRLHLRCTESALTKPNIEVNGLKVFSGGQLSFDSSTFGSVFQGGIMQERSNVSLGATTATRLIDAGVVNMENYAQVLTATPSTTSQVFTLDFNDTGTALNNLPVALYKFVLKNAGSQSCTFTAGSTMAGGGRVKGVDISGQSIGVLDSSSGTITAAAGETIYVEVTNHVSDSAGGDANRFIIAKTICKI